MLGVVSKHFLKGRNTHLLPPPPPKREKEYGPRYWVEATNSSKRKIPFYLCFLPTKNSLGKIKNFRVIVLPMETWHLCHYPSSRHHSGCIRGCSHFYMLKIPLSIKDFLFQQGNPILCLIHVIVIHCTKNS